MWPLRGRMVRRALGNKRCNRAPSRIDGSSRSLALETSSVGTLSKG